MSAPNDLLSDTRLPGSGEDRLVFLLGGPGFISVCRLGQAGDLIPAVGLLSPDEVDL